MKKLSIFPVFLSFDVSKTNDKITADTLDCIFYKLEYSEKKLVLSPENNVKINDIKNAIEDIIKSNREYKHIKIDHTIIEGSEEIDLKKIVEMWKIDTIDYNYSVLFICSFELLLNNNYHMYLSPQFIAGKEIRGLIFEPTLSCNISTHISNSHEKLKVAIDESQDIKTMVLIEKRWNPQKIASKWLKSFIEQYYVWASFHEAATKAAIVAETSKRSYE